MPKEKKEKKDKRKSEKVDSSQVKESLPAGWERRRSITKGTDYFKNAVTGETTWTLPNSADDEDKKKEKKEKKEKREPPSSKKEKEGKADNKRSSIKSTTQEQQERGEDASDSSYAEEGESYFSDDASYDDDEYEDDNWVEKWSERKERAYWKNILTGETTWKEPPLPPLKAGARSNQQKREEKEKQERRKSSSDRGDKDNGKERMKSEKIEPNKSQSKYISQPSQQPPKKDDANRKSISNISGNGNKSSPRWNSEKNGELQPGWEVRYSKSKQREYYKNTSTGETTWDKPLIEEEEREGDSDSYNNNYNSEKEESSDFTADSYTSSGSEKEKNDEKEKEKEEEEGGDKNKKDKDSGEIKGDREDVNQDESGIESTKKEKRNASLVLLRRGSLPTAVKSTKEDAEDRVESEGYGRDSGNDEDSVATPDSHDSQADAQKPLPRGWRKKFSKSKQKHYYIRTMDSHKQWFYPHADAALIASNAVKNAHTDTIGNPGTARRASTRVPFSGSSNDDKADDGHKPLASVNKERRPSLRVQPAPPPGAYSQ